MNAPHRHSTEYMAEKRLHLAEYIRAFCGQRTAPGHAIARACHEIEAGGHLLGRYGCSVKRSDFEALAAFVDYVRREESIPLARERIGTDEQSDRAEYPLTVEALQE